MLTIGRKHRGPRRDHTAFCDICGATWLRSDLTGPDDDGYYRCPDDREGRATKTLDYIRALNASQPSELKGVNDRPGQAPDFTELVAWGWVRGGTAERIDGNLRIRRTGSGRYVATGGTFTTVVAYSFDNYQTTDSYSIPRYYACQLADANTILIRGYNRQGNADEAHGLNAGTGDFIVLAYADTGGRGIVTELGWVWVSGSTGAVLDSGGNVALTPARSATGTYSATLASGIYKFAQVEQFSGTDIGTVTPCFVWGGKQSNTIVSIRSVNNGGIATDADFLVRVYA